MKQAVIVDLAVGWRPEGALGDQQRAAQRARIQAAEDAVLEALGPYGRLRRRLHISGQVALEVDAEGMSILAGLDEVAAVHADTPSPPG